MKDLAYKNYYKLGFSHLIYKKVLGLKKPTAELQFFYVALILTVVLVVSIFT